MHPKVMLSPRGNHNTFAGPCGLAKKILPIVERKATLASIIFQEANGWKTDQNCASGAKKIRVVNPLVRPILE